MIGLLPIARIIRYVAVAYAVLTALCAAIALQFGDVSWSAWTSISFAFSGATVLQLALMVWLCFGWRRFWRWFPALNDLLYPDIGGEWNLKIYWQGHQKHGDVDARATIRQDFVRVSMEVASPSSDSKTLIAQPKRDPESGAPLLYYIYEVTPKSIGANPGSPYLGAAILKFSEAAGGELRGNYWTSRQTSGHFRLSRHM